MGIYAYLSIGTNIGDGLKMFSSALRHIVRSGWISIEDCSHLYNTLPVYITDQPRYLNAALRVRLLHDKKINNDDNSHLYNGKDDSDGNKKSDYIGLKLLKFLKAIEHVHGRNLSPEAIRFGPRPLDIDILMITEEEEEKEKEEGGMQTLQNYRRNNNRKVIVSSFLNEDLALPHPRFHQRHFVLQPLLDIASPDIHIPQFSCNLLQLLLKVEKDDTLCRVRFGRNTTNYGNSSTSNPCNSQMRFAKLYTSNAITGINNIDAINPLIMGVVNVTHDSFSGDGLKRHFDHNDNNDTLTHVGINSHKIMTEKLEEHVMKMINMKYRYSTDNSSSTLHTSEDSEESGRWKNIVRGADLLDIGGMSTRPGHKIIHSSIESQAIVETLHHLRKKCNITNIPISVDTFRSNIASDALCNGADIINDIHAGEDEQMFELAVEHQVPIILMHSSASNSNITFHGDGVGSSYNNSSSLSLENNDSNSIEIINVVGEYLRKKVKKAIRAGVPRWQIIIDPGIGFGKTVDENFKLIQYIDHISQITGGQDVLLGPSRKNYLGVGLGGLPIEERVPATIGACLAASTSNSVRILRVHDVFEVSSALAAFKRCASFNVGRNRNGDNSDILSYHFWK